MNEHDYDTVIDADDSYQVVPYDLNKMDEVSDVFDEVITNLTASADKTADVIKDLTDLAKSSQHHAVYKALALMISTSNETNRELVNTAKAKQDLLKSRGQQDQPTNQPAQVTNNLVVTTTELIDMIRAKNGIQE